MLDFRYDSDANKKFFPSAKKLYDNHWHQNSKEFKQLGTLHKENRQAEYVPNDNVVATTVKRPSVMMDYVPVMKSQLDEDIKAFTAMGGETLESGQLDTKFRAATLKHLIGERLKQESRRSALINQELSQLRDHMRHSGALSP